ncbi:MAG TPA: RagB/SusD family nutrient uptake outer membrane protein [Bacteroidales bacterium]|nr:RagB/SusD family nutrient uptake outer membrane protein [Bacteroidales bacterium]
MKYKIIVLLTIMSLAACEDLEITPSDRLSDASIWTDARTADLFLNDIYFSLNAGPYPTVWTNVPSEISNDPLDNFTDNSTYGPDAGPASALLFNSGSYNPSNTLFNNQWKNMYANIRKCNLFFEKVQASSYPKSTKTVMLAQVRFMRAYFYKQLVDLYGGVPIITEVLRNDDGEDIFYPRNTYDECINFICNESQLAADSLPLKWTGKDLGRITRGAALTMKGAAELYAGRWSAASTTNAQIINELGKGAVYDLFGNYAGLFYQNNENNKEVIMDIQFAPELRYKSLNVYWGVPMVAKGAGWGTCDPTQNLVDSYEFTDGKTEAEGSAMFIPARPYANRDKRFYASVIYDGSMWRGTRIYTRLGIPNNANEINVTGKTGNCGRTGYFTKKQQDSTIYSTTSRLDGLNFIVYRYAEVLLNYAEAKNELSGPDATVYDAVNKVRQRAGQPALPLGLDQSAMRERIRRERRIEFAFEGKYFYDIMRWRTAEQVFSQPIKGMKITSVSGTLKYEKINVRTVTFNPAKNYLQPIPQYALDQNPALTQNPGY